MYVNTNYNSLVSQSNLFKVNNDVGRAMERLSSGLKINNAADNAAGLAISERMTSQIRGMEQALANAQDGISLAQSAEGSLGTVTEMLQRMRVLAVQASTGTYDTDDKVTINDEIKNLVDEISRIAEESHFNGIGLLNTDESITIHISDKTGDNSTVDISLVDVTEIASDLDGINVSTDASGAIEAIDEALETINGARADLGSAQNRLGFISDNLHTSINNTSESRSRILDSDMAKEMSELTKGEILQQTTLAMLSRANSQPQAVVQLLRG